MADNEGSASAQGEEQQQTDAGAGSESKEQSIDQMDDEQLFGIERGAMGSLKLHDEEFFPLTIEHRRAIIRSLARDDERLTKRRKDLEAEGLRAGVAEVDQHIALNGYIKRILAIQIDAFEQTPIGRAIKEGEEKHEASPPIAGDDEITLPDGSRVPIDSIIGKGDNAGEFVVAAGGGPMTIWHAKDEGQWRVVKLALDYPPLAGKDKDSAAAELMAAADAGSIDDGENSHIKDAQVSLTPPKRQRAAGNLAPAVAKTVKKAAVARATGDKKIKITPAPKPASKSGRKK